MRVAGALAGGGGAWAAPPADQVDFRVEKIKKRARPKKLIKGCDKANATAPAPATAPTGTPATIADIAAAATTIHQVAKTIPDLFPPGTGVGVTGSAAKLELWQQWDKFKDLSAGLEKVSATLIETAGKNDPKAIEAGFGAVGKACGACHELYRQKKEKE
ncbi:putative Cytochrome c-556 [Azospirillaceae bacterium]